MANDTDTDQADEYFFSRTFLSSARLTSQHFVWTAKAGFLLHPAVEKRLSEIETPEIVDVAAGNAIVALTLAHDHPKSKVVALDISAGQYPHPWSRPANTYFGVWNFFDPVPEQYCERFDVVYIRAVSTILHGREKTKVVEKLIRMLKPGGYLQWHECCSTAMGVLDEQSPLTPLPGMPDYFQTIEKYVGGFDSAEHYGDLDKVFADNGLVDVDRRVSPVLPHLLKHETDLVVMSMNEVFATLRRRPGQSPEATRELEEALVKMSAAVASGKCFVYLMAVVVGRKPGGQ
ncbi:hypothetical protein AYO21_09240 [Fonsecaea monophora]|uniref:Methyltransferase domain-containing protein n=1 Tax=Fonsecaea monophora TaxID=254056 RepID=A0A177EX14_9EURO|nr:hypothetical protein AYO21_09240 [Fonsecaea monophora]OAG36583.1 hypothetical protein AYO21_09240 [Fonsecaea monophora]